MAQVPFNLPPLISIDLYLSGSSFCIVLKTLKVELVKQLVKKTVHPGMPVNAPDSTESLGHQATARIGEPSSPARRSGRNENW